MLRHILTVAVIFIALAAAAANETQQAHYDACYQGTPITLQKAQLPRIPDREVSVISYGAVGDGVTLTTEAIQKAIDDIAAKGGGHVIIPQGIWLITTLQMRSNVDIHLERNALLQQTPDKSKYVRMPGYNRFYPCLYGEDLHDISITGAGAVDGSGKYWRPVKRAKMSDVEWNQYIALGGTLEENGRLWMPSGLKHFDDVTASTQKEEALRSDLFRPTRCDRVLVQGITFQNSPRFTVHPCQCTNLVIDGVTARSPWNVQNADGIDLSNCRRCLVVNSYVDCGDDGLCLKSGTGEAGVKAGPCQDILIQDCNVAHAHGGFVMGSDVSGGMDKIVVRRCMFSNTDIGLRFKSAVGRGGTTSNVFIHDIVMTDIVNEAVMFNCGYADNRYSAASAEKRDEKKFTETPPYAPDFQNMIIERVTCREAKTAVKAQGIDGLQCIHGITIRNSVFFYREKATEIDDATAQLTLDNVRLETFAKKPTAMIPNGDADANGYMHIADEPAINIFRVDANVCSGIDGTPNDTAVLIRSHSNPNLTIEYAFSMNREHKGRLIVNGSPVDNVGNALHDGYVYYNLSPYANDLYVWGVQRNFPMSEYLFSAR